MPRPPGTLRTRILGRLARTFGTGFVLPAIAAAEFADRNKYANQADAAQLASEERGHAAVVRAAAEGRRASRRTGADIARAEPWHRGASGNDLRAAVLGGNDGLVSNFCLVMGIAGAGASNHSILLAGLAGLVAGACSMALGEWLSVTNARELARAQLATEREEIEQTPEAEQKELALIYQAKGLEKQEAQHLASRIMQDKAGALDTLAREELGIDPRELGGNPWRAGASSFALFALRALVPVVPFFFPKGTLAIALSISFAGIGLSAIGVRHLARQRAHALVLGGAPGLDRRCSGRRDLRDRRAAGRRGFLKRPLRHQSRLSYMNHQAFPIVVDCDAYYSAEYKVH